MNASDKKALIAFPLVILLAFGITWLGSQGSIAINGIPLLMIIVGITFLIQWVSFIPAFISQSEKYFDLTGSLTYVSITGAALYLRPEMDLRSLLLAILVCLWALRLGSFLFARIQRDGKDGRFDELKPSFLRFLNVWNIQALWVSLTALAALITITSQHTKELDLFAAFGLLVWIAGFTIETIADTQKKNFRANPDNKDKFINVGLWTWSRHPNYLGEILLWSGIMVISLPILQGWQWVAVLSPIFVTLLLTQVSGIPLVEERSDVKWGGVKEYEDYKQNTPVLLPRLFSKKQS